MQGTVVQVNISAGGVPKLPVAVAEVTPGGITGDAQNDRKNHGGPERALCIFAIERIEGLAAEGHPIVPGSLGENITTRGIEWEAVLPGSRFELGDGVLCEVTRYTSPCYKITAAFHDGDFNRINQLTHPGWSRVYARVLRGGTVRPGDAVTLVAQPVAAD